MDGLFHGLEAASLRNVAAEAGVSMGTVQHCFTGQQEMLDFPRPSRGRP
jgi:AcrR family transcriptional regulator